MWFPPQYNHPAPGSMSKPEAEPVNICVTTSHPKGISHVQLSRPPVNSMNYELMHEVNQWLLYLGSDPETKAVVISSASPGIFSAGLDFKEISHPTRENFSKFWNELQELWLLVNTFPKPIIAAVNGNSPAGGCAIAIACDYRVMARQKAGADGGRQFTIGLNESQLGIVAPPWAAANYAYILGHRASERMLIFGELLTADEALKAGLVDEVTSDEASCVEAAFRRAERFLTVSNYSHTTTRNDSRRAYIDYLAAGDNRANDTRAMADLVLSDDIQRIIDDYMANLKSKSKK